MVELVAALDRNTEALENNTDAVLIAQKRTQPASPASGDSWFAVQTERTGTQRRSGR